MSDTSLNGLSLYSPAAALAGEHGVGKVALSAKADIAKIMDAAPTVRLCSQHPVLALLVGWVTAALVVVGLLCGVGVLRASYSTRRDGIFVPALMGLCFNGVLAGLAAGVYLVPSSKAVGDGGAGT